MDKKGKSIVGKARVAENASIVQQTKTKVKPRKQEDFESMKTKLPPSNLLRTIGT